jgi:hypothetical protein
MDYTYLPIENTTLLEIKVENIIFTLDTSEPFYDQMVKDFEDVSKLEYFVSLLKANPGTAFTIYNS